MGIFSSHLSLLQPLHFFTWLCFPNFFFLLFALSIEKRMNLIFFSFGLGNPSYKHLKGFSKCMEIIPCRENFRAMKPKMFKGRHEEVKYYSRNGRPSTSNIGWVRQVVCDNQWLTVQMTAGQHDMKKDCERLP